MNPEKWKTSVLGVGPWIVSDNDDPLCVSLGVFRKEEHADLFLEGLIKKECTKAEAAKPIKDRLKSYAEALLAVPFSEIKNSDKNTLDLLDWVWGSLVQLHVDIKKKADEL